MAKNKYNSTFYDRLVLVEEGVAGVSEKFTDAINFLNKEHDYYDFKSARETICKLNDLISELPGLIDVGNYQKVLLEQGRKDSFILDEAIKSRTTKDGGHMTLTERLEDLARVNKGFFRKILPRKKDEEHNELVYEMQSLISTYDNSLEGLYKKGVLYPDNIVTGVGYGVLTIASLARLVTPSVFAFLTNSPDFNNEELLAAHNQMLDTITKVYLPVVAGVTFGSGLGVVLGKDRFEKVSFEQTEYIDKKIEQLYS
jgi:hypothetical protein